MEIYIAYIVYMLASENAKIENPKRNMAHNTEAYTQIWYIKTTHS